jgi:hypothetical protein
MTRWTDLFFLPFPNRKTHKTILTRAVAMSTENNRTRRRAIGFCAPCPFASLRQASFTGVTPPISMFELTHFGADTKLAATPFELYCFDLKTHVLFVRSTAPRWLVCTKNFIIFSRPRIVLPYKYATHASSSISVLIPS